MKLVVLKFNKTSEKIYGRPERAYLLSYVSNIGCSMSQCLHMKFTEKTAMKMSYTKFQHTRRIVKWFV
jgi:hypothetical protein